MREQLISFKTAKKAKEKGFEIETLHFYTKPNSKMFGIDEKGRSYPIKNTSKKLYKCGEQAALNIESVYLAPTQSLLQKWLRDNHNIIIDVVAYYDEKDLPLTKTNKPKPKGYFVWNYYDENFTEEKAIKFSDYEEALEIGLLEALNLIEKQN
jgi:hypothetical protein